MILDRAAQSANGSQFSIDTELGAMNARRWYVVQTQPHCEGRAVKNLERQRFLVFSPRIRRTIRHARRATTKLVPFFPNYVFVELDTSCEQWRCINGTYGVVRLLADGDRPSVVPVGIVEALMARMQGDGTINWSDSLPIGALVRVVDGPFVDYVGTLERFDSGPGPGSA